MKNSLKELEQKDRFIQRHIGPSNEEIQEMLKTLDVSSLDELIRKVVPDSIRMLDHFELPPSITEIEALNEIKLIAKQNKISKSMIGMGYYGTYTPPVILRNILENPGWYTAYTPYQPEISQGR